MKYAEKMMRLISTQSLAVMASGYSKQDTKGKLGPDDIRFWDAINAELIRRGAL